MYIFLPKKCQKNFFFHQKNLGIFLKFLFRLPKKCLKILFRTKKICPRQKKIKSLGRPLLIPCCLAYFLLYQTLETRRSLSVSCCIAPVTFSLYFAGLQNSSDTCDRDWYNKEQEQASTMITS